MPIGGRSRGPPFDPPLGHHERPTTTTDHDRARDVSMTTTTAALSHRRPAWRRPRLLGILATAVVIAAATFAWGAVRPSTTPTPSTPAATVTPATAAGGVA